MKDLNPEHKWKQINGFPKYYISDNGEIYGPGKNKKGALIKPFLNKRGYQRVVLFNGSKKQIFTLSRLVLEAFVGPAPSDKHHAAHSDGNIKNNALSNLRWASPVENERDKRKHGTHGLGERNSFAKLTEQDVIQIRKLFKKKNQTSSNAQELADRFGVDKTNIFAIVRYKSWRHVK